MKMKTKTPLQIHTSTRTKCVALNAVSWGTLLVSAPKGRKGGKVVAAAEKDPGEAAKVQAEDLPADEELEEDCEAKDGARAVVAVEKIIGQNVVDAHDDTPPANARSMANATNVAK